MSNYQQLPVYLATHQLTVASQRAMKGLSRDVRYTVGQRLVEMELDIMAAIYEANLTRDKHPQLMRGRVLIAKVKAVLRLLCDMRQVSQGLYLQLAEQAESVSKQLTAWDNKSLQPQYYHQ